MPEPFSKIPYRTAEPICSHAGSEACIASEESLPQKGREMLGSEKFYSMFNEAKQTAQGRIPQGLTVKGHVHVVNQIYSKNNPDRMNALMVYQYQNNSNGVYIHQETQPRYLGIHGPMFPDCLFSLAPSIHVADRRVPTSGPVQELKLGEICAEVTLQGTMRERDNSRPSTLEKEIIAPPPYEAESF